MKLDLGCGNNKQDGYIGVDKVKMKGVDRVVDLEKYPWPWKSDTIEEIYCRHYVELVDDLISFMDECYRILKWEGKLVIVSPYYASTGAWQDPHTKRSVSEGTFAHFNAEWRKQAKVDHYEIKSDFEFVPPGYYFNPGWQTRSEESRTFALIHYNNVVVDIQATLIKKKREK